MKIQLYFEIVHHSCRVHIFSRCRAMPPRRRPPEQPAPTASTRTSVEPRHTPHRRPVLVCQHISTSLNIVAPAIINILSPQLSCSHTERVTSPADARTKRLFASGVPVRSRARMKTQSCKALKRDVPRGSREGAHAVERGLRGRRSCSSSAMPSAPISSARLLKISSLRNIYNS